MADLVYYYVPDEYVFLDKDQRKLCDLDIQGWKQIFVADSPASLSVKRSWREGICFFVDEYGDLAHFLWDIKLDTEKLLLIKKQRRFKPECISEVIENQTDLKTCLEKLLIPRQRYAFIYINQNEPIKFVSISGGETIEISVKQDCVADLEHVVETWATKTDYYTYELDLEE